MQNCIYIVEYHVFRRKISHVKILFVIKIGIKKRAFDFPDAEHKNKKQNA